MVLLHFSSPTSHCSLSCQRYVASLMATAELPVRHCPPLHLHSYSETQILTSHNEPKNKKKLDTKTLMTYLKKLAGRFCSVSPNNFISYVYLFLQDKQNQMRLIRSKFSIRKSFIQTYSDLFLFSQVSYEFMSCLNKNFSIKHDLLKHFISSKLCPQPAEFQNAIKINEMQF